MDFKKSKRMSAVMAIAAASVLTVGSMAYFTDRVNATATSTAGTLDLNLTQTWVDDNAAVSQIFAPGKKLDLDYTLANQGNKSADVKETITIVSDVELAGAQAEFEIYSAKDVTLDKKTSAYKPNPGAAPLADRTLSPDGKKLTYELPEYILNGTGKAAETEGNAVGTEKVGDYVLVFRDNAENKFQGKNISINYMAQAKQHRNTGADTWTTVQSESLEFAGAQVPAVPEVPSK